MSCRLGEGAGWPGHAGDDDGDVPPSPPDLLTDDDGPTHQGAGWPPIVSFGDFIKFQYEGSLQGGCETMHFAMSAYAKDKLESRVITNVEYFYSLTGLGIDVPGSNTDLNSNVVPELYQGNQNFIFVGKVKVTLGDGTTEFLASKCLLDCVAGGPAPGERDPERC